MGRQGKNIHYIYKTTCNVTGKWYVGMRSTDDINDSYMGSGKILRYSIRKHGIDNHTKEILEYCNSREELVLRETEIVTKELISDGKCMNLKEGGNGGFISNEQQKHRSICGGKSFKDKLITDLEFKESHKKRVSKNMKKNHLDGKISYNTFEGKSHSEESKKKCQKKPKNVLVKQIHSSAHVG
jgi:hypothetical protein